MIKHLLWILFIATLSLPALSQTTDFTYQSTGGDCLPINIQFTQISTGTPKGYLWDFGNGAKSNQANPIVTFTTAGYYTVRLITVYENNTAQKTRTILVHPSISVSFTSDVSYVCQPGTVNFTASSSNNLANYIWDYGDGSPLITGTSNNISHTYSGYGDFTITLKAISTTGCEVIATRNVKIIKPEITGSIMTAMTGCVPMATVFRATVIVPPNSSVNNYTWDFGDASSTTTTIPQVSHTYTQVGSFSTRLTVTTTEGCTNTYNYDSLRFGRPPTNEIAYPMDTVYCGSETPQFVCTATDANRYDWDFGGSITSVTDTLAEHRYSNLGPKHITVTPVFNGCPGTPISFNIDIIGVIARFTYRNTCEDKKTFKFKNTSQGNISTINWSLGNQAYSTDPDSVMHTYPPSGVFGVKLLITDNITGCVDSFKTRIYTANPVMKNDANSICINSDTQFSVLYNYANPSLSYLWNVLGGQIGPTPEAAPIVHADSLGHFNNSVILDNGPQYCEDTIQLDHMITVRGPQLDFTAPTSICLNTPLTVVNLSHPFQPADTINLWYWNFGRVITNDTIYQPQPYSYTNPKIYNVKLVATDITGCTDSLVKQVHVRPMPFLWIIPRLDTVCEGQSSTLIGYTSDDILWTPGNTNFCTTCDTTTISPVQTTKYYATATNGFNCVTVDSAVIRVFNPFTAHPLVNDTAFCGGKSIQLDVEPKNKVITWSPPAGLSNINIYNPVASPTHTTVYQASLIDSAGCYGSTADIKVTIKPIPLVDAGPDKIYPYNTSFTLSPTYSSNVIDWSWSPFDSLSCASCPNPVTKATFTKTYTLRVRSDSGCVAQDKITIFVECNGASLLLPNAFTPNNDGRNDLYRPITRGIKYINRFAIFNRQGQLIYEMKGITPGEKSNPGWDGKYLGQIQSPAAYIYYIEAICDLGQTVTQKGSFILIR